MIAPDMKISEAVKKRVMGDLEMFWQTKGKNVEKLNRLSNTAGKI
jgi:hypothetical protein